MGLAETGPGWLFCPADRPERFAKAAAARGRNRDRVTPLGYLTLAPPTTRGPPEATRATVRMVPSVGFMTAL